MNYFLIGYLTLTLGCSAANQQPVLHDFAWSAPLTTQSGIASVSINAPTWLWDNRIRYRLLYTSPSQIRFYGLDRWIAAPPELLEQVLTSSGKNPDYTLLIRLQDFEQLFDSSDRARVVLHFFVEAYLLSGKHKIGVQEFYLQKITKTPDAAGAISGFSDLAQQADINIHEWLTGLSARQH
jgi:cholesterol transport system auxiliary component